MRLNDGPMLTEDDVTLTESRFVTRGEATAKWPRGIRLYYSMPKYRAVVYPKIFDGRDENTRVLKVNDDITLNLEPGSILHENFFVRTYRNGIPEHQYFDVRDLQKNLYHDERQYAAVVLSEEGGMVQVEGVVGPNLKIRPLETGERSEHGLQAHLIENIEDNDSVVVYGKHIEDKIAISERAANHRTGFDSSKYHASDIFPEVFLVCDSRFQLQFNGRMNLTVYLMITMQVVRIRYSALSNPRVHIVLRGIELSHWKQEHEYYVYYGKGIDAYKSLQGLVKFISKKNETYGAFDMVYFVTGFDMIAVYSDGTTREELQGYAFVASACTTNRQQLGEDQAYSYQGIRVMTHEIAHTLGCSHDGTTAPGVVKAFIPDSTQCPWGDGYIMSYLQEDIRSMQFSHCCKYDIQRMSWSFEAACLHINISVTFPITRYELPGEFVDLNQQCRIMYPQLSRTHFIDRGSSRRSCRGYCLVPGEDYGPASDGQWDLLFLDGTTCSETPKAICINGVCRRDLRVKRPQNPYNERTMNVNKKP
ncbi:metalloproteinase-like [Rhipicephalus sanguineus]|uniref:metalloproteinase-like n=1 Tax=Rhipicephalus sanguineus TaxID=34632 RepID=UPI0020C1BC54|nr:metalloproteinase-like [Rhipicephalus sanguineus]